jgi:hypothetical protein
LKVITMTVTGEHRARARGLAAGTWIAVAAVPVAWALGIFLALLSGEGGTGGAGPLAVGLLGVAVFAAGPAAAVALAVRLRRTGHRSGEAALVVAGSLLALTLLVTMLVGPIAMIAVAIVMALLAGYLWRSRTRSGPSGSGPRRPGWVGR